MNLEELRKIAESATPGEWERRIYEGVPNPKSKVVKVLAPENEFGYDRVVNLADYVSRENAEFIATFNPELIVALLDRVETAEQALQRVLIHTGGSDT